MTTTEADHFPLTSRHWRYSTEGLDKVRSELNEHAVSRVRSLWEEERVRTPLEVAL